MIKNKFQMILRTIRIRIRLLLIDKEVTKELKEKKKKRKK